MAGIRKKIDKGIAYLKRNGIRETCHRVYRKAVLSKSVNYEHWLKRHSASRKILERQGQMSVTDGPMIQVVLYAGRLSDRVLARKKTMQSLEQQTYTKYQIWDGEKAEKEPSLVLEKKNEQREFFLFVPEGVVFLPEAFYEFVRAAGKAFKRELVYSDQDEISEDGKHLSNPFMKPKYDPVFWKEVDYIGPVLMVSAEVMNVCMASCYGAIGIREDLNEICQMDLYSALQRWNFQSKKVYRIPRVLYHVPWKWAEKVVSEKEKMAFPLLSVVIPNKDYSEGLRMCVTSLIELGGYPNLEILIVDNNSTEDATYQCYDDLVENYPQVKIMKYTDQFNYSAINNEAVTEVKGEYLLFLNNDTKVKESGSIARMMRWILEEKSVGAVGARLVYGDGTIQHGGVVLGYGGIAGHAFEGMTEELYNKLLYSNYARQMAAVTAACMIVKREAFEDVKGFETKLGVAYNDIDFCMKLRKKGWKVVYEPKAKWYHYESQTRGLEMTREKGSKLFLRKMEA